MKTSSIRVEGNIISPELFDKLDSKDILGQNPSDYGFDRSFKVKDDIARTWADAKDQWNIFKRRTEKLTENQSGVEETRKFWIIPLLENLGYKVEFQRSSEIVNEKSYAISHRVETLDYFPVHIMGVNDNLDKRRENGGPRMSPHALLQEYLNVTDHVYGIVTNGNFLRILRDSGKLVRLSYLEFNLQRMLEDDLYAEFSIMYRLIHSSRMPKKQTEADQCIFEQYHQDAIESGSRIREKLSVAVEKSIKIIANGFLTHPASQTLRSEVIEGKLKPEDFFKQLLRFIYRILFLLVIEERDIVYPEIGKDTTHDEKDKLLYLKKIYYEYYSISRLRKLAEKIHFFDDKIDDLWISLNNTFNIFIEERYAKKLGIYPLGGDLFSSDAIGLLNQSQLDNKTLLECIRNLSLFESTNGKDVIRVNYAALNVEEFGSVYEGLLEYDGKFNFENSLLRGAGGVSFEFVKSSERSSSGSHYTPEELVQPLIKHSLDYVIEDKLKNSPFSKGGTQGGSEREAKAQSLLSIKVCDVAAGSGHILLSAARRIAIELARVRTGEDQPSPEPYRQALRDVINHCIYGVDKNPLAVELCKVALWLEAYNPGLPLSFLDHKIKCGDSIVGLARREELEKGIANEAFKKMPGDDAEVVKYLTKKNKDEIAGQLENLFDKNAIDENVKQISTQFRQFEELPEQTLEEVTNKAKQYDVMKGIDWWRLKEAADIQVAQFFIPKTKENQNKLTTFSQYFNILSNRLPSHGANIHEAKAVALDKRFFHWFLEFPDVFNDGGFDCVLGNPPFLGGTKISTNYGSSYLNYLYGNFVGMGGRADLVGYFFRRIYSIIKYDSYLSLISTNTISQGDTKEGVLDYITSAKGEIVFCIKSIKWPGLAAVEVSLISIIKGKFKKLRTLNNQKVEFISQYLSDSIIEKNPYQLIKNILKAFEGYYLLGNGFVINEKECRESIHIDPNNSKVIFPYFNGQQLFSTTDFIPDAFAINFDEMSLDEAKKYKEPFRILEERVKPEREKKDKDKYPQMINEWWKYWRSRQKMKEQIGNNKHYLAQVIVTKNHAPVFLPSKTICSNSCVIYAFDEYSQYSIIQTSFHDSWAWKYSSTMKTDRSYSIKDAFETFPFPQNFSKETEIELEKIGEEYHEFRRQLMLNLQLGLTKTYNLFHTPELIATNPQLAKAKLQIPIEQAVKDIQTLRQLHKQMDEAVLKAYGWTDINLAHNFYEVDYLPENDRIRYTISPEARREILKRLLELNHKIHAEEVAAGLWDKKGKKKEKLVPPKPKDEGQEKLF